MSPGYGCTEYVFGMPLSCEDIDVFVINCLDVIKYVNVVDNQAQVHRKASSKQCVSSSVC